MEYLALILLILFGFGSAILMASRSKTRHIISGRDRSSVDTTRIIAEISDQLTKTIRQEIKNLLSEMKQELINSRSERVYGTLVNTGRGQVSMDESIIPTNVSIDVEATNITGAATEEKVVDTKLGEAKSRLAGVLNRRKEKE